MRISFILGLALLSFVFGCYRFDSDPLKDSGLEFQDTNVFSQIQNQFGVSSIPKAPEANGQPSPFGDLSLTSSALQINDHTALYSFKQRNAWEVAMVTLSGDHIFVCNMFLTEEKMLIMPSSNLNLKFNDEPMNTHSVVSGDAKLYLDYAKQLADESIKTCLATPIAALGNI